MRAARASSGTGGAHALPTAGRQLHVVHATPQAAHTRAGAAALACMGGFYVAQSMSAI